MESDEIDNLRDFGLSKNEAKVFVTILNYKWKSVRHLASLTGIHCQDLYRIFRRLEDKGVAIVSTNRPIVVEAIPINIALKNLIEAERKLAQQRIERLENSYSTVVENIRNKCLNAGENQETTYILKDGSKAIQARIDFTFENLRKDYIAVVADDPNYEYLSYLKSAFKKLAKRGVYVRILVLLGPQSFDLHKHFKSIMSEKLSFEIRTLKSEKLFSYAIIDNEELWIGLSRSHLTALVTSSKSIVAVVKNQFDHMWQVARPYAKSQ